MHQTYDAIGVLIYYSYVHSLMTRLGRLRSVQAAVNSNDQGNNAFPSPQHNRSISAPSIELRQPDWVGGYSSQVSFDKHLIIRNANPTCWQFLGSSSPYALAVELLVHAMAKFGPVTNPQRYTGTEFALNAYKPEGLEPPEFRSTPSHEEMEMLTNLYLSTTNVLHGYSDNEAVLSGIGTYQRYHGTNVKSLTGSEAYQYFRAAMICAIGAANKARHQQQYATECVAYYQEGVQCLEEVTSDISSEALEALLLLIMFALLHPRKCDLWKLLDYACRLSVELSFHTETNDEFEDEQTRQRRRSLFWGLYCLERSIGQHLGRPSDLPEEVITAEYPATLDALTYANGQAQYALVAHYYRLIYVRSEIFRELYMPASAPDLPRSWYEQRLDQFLTWRREYRGVEQLSGMGTMTCEMGFDTSICFLFQPLLLRALVATKETHLTPNCQEVIPHESYDAAMRSVIFYTNILRAPENTPAGDYPLTVMSAHYIQQAVFTVLAHCLLAIDGRLPVVTFSGDPSISNPGPLDLRLMVEHSESCLYLCSFLADKFPGMIGAFDICKNVLDKVLPIIVQGTLG